MTELIFEKYEPRGFFIGKEAALSAFASGKYVTFLLRHTIDSLWPELRE